MLGFTKNLTISISSAYAVASSIFQQQPVFFMKSPATKTVLILGLGHPRQEPFLRSLHQGGMNVYAAHVDRKEKRRSRFLAGFFQLPNDEMGQLEALEKFGLEHGPNIFLVASNDEYIALVSQNRESLSRHFNIPLPGWDIVRRMMDRREASRIAGELGISIPKTWEIKSEAEMLRTIEELDTENFDHILKTLSVLSEPADEGGLRQTKPAPRDKQAMVAMCHDIQRRTGAFPLIQQVIPGQADAAVGVTMLVGPDEKIELSYCVQRLRLTTYQLAGAYVHPYVLGSVVWCQTVHDEEAVEKARALVAAFRYTGLAVIEFRRHLTTNELFLMKVEPRPVRATALATAIGMDIPTAMYAAFNEQPVEVADDYSDGVQWLYIQGCLESLFNNDVRNRRDLLRLLLRMPKMRAFAEDLKDPVPLIAGAAKLAFRRIRRKQPLTAHR
ncbi:hypothetical protein [Erythrobacter litoralis]|uniref:ATP-grasp domain-containing protein n=1 Tax=Erythrobacter litoralis (strain HTCC2594) TaxID=314225 RepID=Q2N8U3_ERYLH|nr:hypothetical protein [Erythrobacter litoralis]ABC63898.1 hypothetical protein ELI_09030 [Erythrobacter litoralis HTCC2594]